MPKRVLHLRGSGALLGAERVVLELARWSPNFGYEPLIVAPHPSRAAPPEYLTVAAAEGVEASTLACDGRLDLRFLRRLRRLVRNKGVDIIHTHGYKEDVLAALAGLSVPLVATNHLWKRTTRQLRLYSRLDGLVLRRFDQIVAVSDPILAELRAAGIAEHKLSRIPNGIDTERVRPPSAAERATARERLGFDSDELVLGMLGSLTPEKGHAFALEALGALSAEYPRLRLCIVGDGPLRETLAREIERRGLASQARLCGRRSDIPQVLAGFDVFLLPSLKEGLPMALLEAMAAGLPAVASAVGDVGKAVEDGISGRLIPPGRTDAMVQALSELAADSTYRRQLGERARARVTERFSSRGMTSAYCRLYDRQLEAAAAVIERRA